METMPDCVMPAAGASSRMGAWKPLLPYGASCIAGKAMEAALGAGCRVILVLGHRADEMEAWASSLGLGDRLVLVRNPDWTRGFASSVAAGMEEAKGEAFFVAPADMPEIPSRAYVEITEARRSASSDVPAIPRFRGEFGHPVLIPSRLKPAIAALKGEARIRPLVLASSPIVVDLPYPGILLDLDSPQDYDASAPR